MELPFFQVDAFTSTPFGGNPAAILLLEKMEEDDLLQKIASENNLSETAFLLKKDDTDSTGRYSLRWFTPNQEVDLCGHATLASAHVLFSMHNQDELLFETQSGILTAKRLDDQIQLDFPSRPPVELSTIPKDLTSIEPIGAFSSRDLVLLFKSEEEILALEPIHQNISKIDSLGVIVTATGTQSDFVSRFFAPKVGVPEDPVTGSAHATLAPFWQRRIKKNKLTGIQLSNRKGEVFCEVDGDRVKISGRCKSIIRGSFTI